MYKYLVLMFVSCAVLTAEEQTLSIGIVDEATTLQKEVAQIKEEMRAKIAANPDLSEELKNKAYLKLDQAEFSEEIVQKIADESAVSDNYKSKAIKQIRKHLKKINQES